jgi:hypothetical protein
MTEGRIYVNGVIVQRAANNENENPQKKAKNGRSNSNKTNHKYKPKFFEFNHETKVS